MLMGPRKKSNLMPKAKVVLEIMNDGFKYFNQLSLHYSQNTWCKLLKKKSGRDIKRRQFNYDMKGLVKLGIIKRYCRHRKDKERGFIFQSSKYYIAPSGWKLAAIFKIVPWKTAWKMIAAIKKGAQFKINKPKKWVTPAWMKEFMGQKEEIYPVPDV